MEILTVILLLLLGVVLLIIEFMLIPGLTVAGIGSLISFGASIFLAFKYWGNLVGIIVLAAVLIFVPVMLYYFFKGKAMKPIMLNSNINGKVISVDDQKIHVGDEGVSIGRLNPMGKVKINGVALEARSRGSYVDQKTKIKVIKIDRNTVIVEPINT